MTTIDVRHETDHVVLVVSGALERGPHLERLRETLRQLTADGHRSFVVQMTGVHLDSAGLGELARVYEMVAGGGGTLRILGLDARFESLLPITRLLLRRSELNPIPTAPKPYEIPWGVRIGVGIAMLIIILVLTLWQMGGF